MIYIIVVVYIIYVRILMRSVNPIVANYLIRSDGSFLLQVSSLWLFLAQLQGKPVTISELLTYFLDKSLRPSE